MHHEQEELSMANKNSFVMLTISDMVFHTYIYKNYELAHSNINLTILQMLNLSTEYYASISQA